MSFVRCKTLYTGESVILKVKNADSTILLDPGVIVLQTHTVYVTPDAITDSVPNRSP
ncbi:hypothetical protein HYALB_00011421, partial [Hymenoscyphus albidus]